MLPQDWEIKHDPDTPMIRKWILVTPAGKTSRWRTKKYAIAHAEVCFIEEQAKKVRRILTSFQRKYGARFNEVASLTSESYYFFAQYHSRSNLKIRISTHRTVDETQDFDIVGMPVDSCALRAFLKKRLLRRKSLNVA